MKPEEQKQARHLLLLVRIAGVTILLCLIVIAVLFTHIVASSK